MTHTRTLALLLSMGATAGLTDAQTRPSPIRVAVRVVGHEDGRPRPGAEVYVPTQQSVRLNPDGFLIAEDVAIRALRHAIRARVDPEGRASLQLKTRPRAHDLNVAEPFYRIGMPQRTDGVWIIRVGTNVPVGVLVQDARGAPVAGMPVCVHVAGRDLAVALSDGKGRAMLGISPKLKARAIICPAGWVGRRDGFPTVAESLAGRRSVRIALPPHGSIRMRRLRAGRLEPGPVRAAQLNFQTSYGTANPSIRAAADRASGVLYPHVALGLQLGAHPQFGSRTSQRFRGPTKPGEVRDVDVELGGRITVQCRLPDGTAAVRPLTVRLLTDAEERRFFTRPNHEGGHRVEVGGPLRGSRLLRIHIDGDGCSASQACSRAIPLADLDLGTVSLLATKPQLRGSVVDPSGRPVPGARVLLSPDGRPNTGYYVQTDADGRFVSSGPVLRDRDGVPLQLVAGARSQDMESPAIRGVAGTVRLVLQPRKPRKTKRKPIPISGTLVVRVAEILDPNAARLRFQLKGEHAVGRFPKVRNPPGGGSEVEFYSLAAGSYSLLARAPDRGMFVVLDDLIVPGDGPCQDPRLDGLDPGKHLRQAVVQVIDEESVPVAGARISSPGCDRRTDGEGKVTLYLGKTTKTLGMIEVQGKRTVRCDEWTDGLVIRVEKAAQLTVQVRNLPEDVPRGSVEVWVRDEQDRWGGPKRLLRADGTATMPLPARGPYRLHLLVASKGPGSRRRRQVYADSETVELGENKNRTLTLRLSKVGLQRLRAALRRER